LTALLKKGGGVHRIAVGEVLHPYGQVGFGIPGGLECAIHATCHFLSLHGADDSQALLKVCMKNAFNECSHHAFLPVYLMIFQRFQLG